MYCGNNNVYNKESCTIHFNYSQKGSSPCNDIISLDKLKFPSYLSGRRRSKRQVRPTQLICRTSSTESLREDLLMTWLPMEASSTQVRLITHLVLERLPSPLLQVRQVFTCREVTGPSPARRGLRVANPPGGGRRSANPSRGEVRRLISVWKQQHRDTKYNGHVCLSPACWHAKIWTGEDSRGSDQPEQRETGSRRGVCQLNTSIEGGSEGGCSDGALPLNPPYFFFCCFCHFGLKDDCSLGIEVLIRMP